MVCCGRLVAFRCHWNVMGSTPSADTENSAVARA